MDSFNKLFKIVQLSRDEFWVILTYGIATAFLSLIVPVAAQSLVNIVSFGSVTQPLFILTFIVFVLITSASLFRILQTILVETLQQRIFARVSLKAARKLLGLDIKAVDSHQATELMNRFFDIVTIQSASANILLNGTGVVLQGLFGIILLAFYHPALLIFDLIFVLLLALIIVIPFRKALNLAIDESNAKFKVAGWLEEIAKLPMLFRLQNYAKFGFNRTDNLVCKYILARQQHFRKLLQHIYGAYSLNIIASTSLLLIGGLLVIKNQMTLGQLVAAEIIVSMLSAGVARLGKNLEEVYDLLSAAQKVNVLLTLPAESQQKSVPVASTLDKNLNTAPSIELRRLKIHPNSNDLINILISSSQHFAILGDQGSGKSLLVDILLGLRPPAEGLLEYNHISLKEFSIDTVRSHCFLIRGIYFFAGTILENLQMGNPRIELNTIHHLLRQFKLDKVAILLEDEAKSDIGEVYKTLSTSELQKLMFIRAILTKPLVLVVDEALDALSETDLALIIEILQNPIYTWTLIVTTRRESIANYFEHQIKL